MILKTRGFIIKQNNMSLRNINEYVTKFIAGKPELVEAWQDAVNQESLKKMVSGGGRKERVSKDKDKPRKMSAYLYFCKENRESVKKSLGDSAKNTEITTELGKRWNDIKSDASKVKKYNDLAEKDAESFKEKMKDYKPSSEPVKAKREKKEKKEPSTRGKSSYLFFCADNRDKVKADLGDAATPTAVTTELGKRWNVLKEDTSKESKAMIASYTAKAEASKQEKKQVKPEKEVKQEKKEVKQHKKDVVIDEEVLEDEDEETETKKVVAPKAKAAPKDKAKKAK